MEATPQCCPFHKWEAQTHLGLQGFSGGERFLRKLLREAICTAILCTVTWE